MEIQSRKKILIFFPQGNLPYSPSTINLYDELSKYYKVTIYSSTKDQSSNKRNVVNFTNKVTLLSRLYYECYRIFNNFFGRDIIDLRAFCTLRSLRKYLNRNKFDEIISVDLLATFLAQKLHSKVHLFSLEISDLTYLNLIDLHHLRSVIIQREDRYDYLFNEKHPNIILIQNAPVFKNKIVRPKGIPKSKLLFNGYASKGFGIYACLNFLNEYSEFNLTIKGALETDLIENVIIHYSHLQFKKQFIVDSEYLDEDDILTYLAKFRIGFCFYDLRLPAINNFNYHSAPSGKMFKYFAAGLPVIGVKIPGLSYIEEFKAGVLINDLSPNSIKSAIDLIEEDYEEYSINAFRAAQYFSFDKSISPLISLLMDN